MLTRKALWIPALASAGLLIVLVVAGWGSNAGPVSSPQSGSLNSSTAQSVSIMPTPNVADITVKTTTPSPTTTTTTTPKPPPVQAPPPVQQPTTTTESPQQGLFVHEGAPCRPEGALGLSPRGEPLLCRKDPDRNDRLRWQKA
ncbi:hypothetical protein ACIA8G_23800 [Lentzea sp. NPDC051213]|uniref:hypothetical protein n=1 Tax=Lentzea sp. NPDC051213 TaxID=3364126 RepID=UPI00378B1020